MYPEAVWDIIGEPHKLWKSAGSNMTHYPGKSEKLKEGTIVIAEKKKQAAKEAKMADNVDQHPLTASSQELRDSNEEVENPNEALQNATIDPIAHETQQSIAVTQRIQPLAGTTAYYNMGASNPGLAYPLTGGYGGLYIEHHRP